MTTFSFSKCISKKIKIKITKFHRGIGGPNIYEALFGGKPRAGLASMNLGELEDGALTAEQLWEVLGNNNNKEEDVEEVEVTLGGSRHVR